MNKSIAQTIDNLLKTKMREVADALGLDVEVRGGTFDDGTFHPRITFKERDADRLQFVKLAPLYGLTADDFGRTFSVYGKTYRVSGLRPTARAKPIVTTCDGKTYVWPAATILQELRKVVNHA